MLCINAPHVFQILKEKSPYSEVNNVFLVTIIADLKYFIF